MKTRTRASWPLYALGAATLAAIVAAVLVVGPAPASQSSVTRTATVAQGVVQSTVSGTGNLAPISQLDLGFKTAGTVTHIYVKQGQEVAEGQLLATLDPQSAEVALEQSKASLQSAEASLAQEEETGGEGTSSQGNSGSGATAGAASVSSTTKSSTPLPAEATGSEKGANSSTEKKQTTGTRQTTTATETSTGTTSTTSTVSAATREANLASASAAVKSDRLTVQSDEEAVQDTRLYAPEDGTIASLSGEVGEVVSGSGTTRVSSSEGSSSSSTTGGSTAARGSSTSAASSSSSGASSSGFAVLTNLSSMELVVPLSESEISSVRRGQPATVTVEALAGRKFAAHVSEVAILSTSNSGVVSYDVTFKLDQMEAALKPGMSASAEVVVKQAQGINVPTSAITAGSVTVLQAGKHVSRAVTTGLAGDTSTIILSGLKAGETIVLPSATTTTSSSSSSGAGRTSGGTAGGGFGGAGFGAAGGGPPGLTRGGG